MTCFQGACAECDRRQARAIDKASDGRTFLSADGLSQYRPGSFKPNLGALSESARLLWPDGRLVIETGPGGPVGEIVRGLGEASFSNITVEMPGLLRITGILP
jgi:hypothetical protein